MQPLPAQRGRHSGCGSQVLLQAMAHAEPRQRLAALVPDTMAAAGSSSVPGVLRSTSRRSSRAVLGQTGHRRTLFPLPCRRTWCGTSKRNDTPASRGTRSPTGGGPCGP